MAFIGLEFYLLQNLRYFYKKCEMLYLFCKCKGGGILKKYKHACLYKNFEYIIHYKLILYKLIQTFHGFMGFSLLLRLFHVQNDVNFPIENFEKKKRRRKNLIDAELWISQQKVGHVGNNLDHIRY